MTENETPAGWERVGLAEIAEVRLGRQRSPDRADGPNMRPYMRAANVTWRGIDPSGVKEMDFTPDEFTTYALQDGDILLSEASGSQNEVGKSAVWRGEIPECCFQNTLIRVRAADPILVRFLQLHFLKDALTGRFAAASRGVGIHHLGAAAVVNWQVTLPPVAEQNRIVAIIDDHFSRLDSAVALLERVQRNLNRYRASILTAAVEGRLVPTEAALARAEGRTYEPADVLLERILVERRRRWEQSGRKGKYDVPTAPDTTDLPELPEGWCWASVEQLVWRLRDGPHYSPKYAEEGIPFITGGNVRPEGVDFDSAKRITPQLHAELSKRIVPEVGDVLYTKGGTTGIARVNTYRREFNVWVHVAVLKLVGFVEPFYLQHALNSPWCYAQSQRLTHGVGNQDLGLTRMIGITIPLPPVAEQRRIIEELDRLHSTIATEDAVLDANLARCTRLRQSILKWAFEGRLADQDPTDEPVRVLLDRIRSERAAAGGKRPPRRGRAPRTGGGG